MATVLIVNGTPTVFDLVRQSVSVDCALTNTDLSLAYPPGAEEPALIVLDATSMYSMGEVIRTCRYLRDNVRFAACSLLVLTGNATAQEAGRIVEKSSS